LMFWEIWKEQNTRVFRNSASTANMLVAIIKEDVAMWRLARAKAASIIMPREYAFLLA
jgi:hypothetical protein